MLINHLEGWLCAHHPNLQGITHEVIMTFVLIISLLGLIAAVRRRERSQALLFGGLFLAFLMYPVRLFLLLRAEQFTGSGTPFITYVDAMQPVYVFGSVGSNFLQPIGCILGLCGAITTLKHSRRSTPPQVVE